jgi:hypothetical protein
VPSRYVAEPVISGAGVGDGDAPGDGDEDAVGDGEAVTDGEGDGEAIGDGAGGDAAAEEVEDGGRPGRWVPTATTAGLTAARGPRAGELTRGAVAGRVPGTAGGAVVSVGEAAARGLGVQLLPLAVREPEEFAGAFQAAIEGQAQALIMHASPLFGAHRARLDRRHLLLQMRKVTGQQRWQYGRTGGAKPGLQFITIKSK